MLESLEVDRLVVLLIASVFTSKAVRFVVSKELPDSIETLSSSIESDSLAIWKTEASLLVMVGDLNEATLVVAAATSEKLRVLVNLRPLTLGLPGNKLRLETGTLDSLRTRLEVRFLAAAAAATDDDESQSLLATSDSLSFPLANNLPLPLGSLGDAASSVSLENSSSSNSSCVSLNKESSLSTKIESESVGKKDQNLNLKIKMLTFDIVGVVHHLHAKSVSIPQHNCVGRAGSIQDECEKRKQSNQD